MVPSKKQIIHKTLNEFNNLFFNQESPHDYFLNGKTGLALYYFYFSKITSNKSFNKKADQLLTEIIEKLGDPYLFYGGSFTLGLSGLTSALLIMKEENFIDFSDEDLAELDEVVFNWANDELEILNTDFLHGAAGALNYFVERCSDGNERCLFYATSLIKSFHKLAISDDSGIRFPNKFYKNRFPEFTNLSVSHGLIGVLMIFIKALKKGIEAEICTVIINGGIKYLKEVYFLKPYPKSGNSIFFVSLNELTTEFQYTDRLAWCYGDLNVALFFHAVADLYKNKEYYDIGYDIGSRTVQRKSQKTTEIVTPFFCHGTSGTALFYKSLYQLTNEPVYKKAYDYWTKKTYRMLDLNKISLMSHGPFSFLDGPMGLAYFLISECSEEQLKWEKFFLL
jgi:lantibiotic modifying enzyme